MNLIRGFSMGAADIVPGVSGGTIALLLGVYHRLITSIRFGARALGRLVRLDFAGAYGRLRQIEWVFIGPLLLGIGAAILALAPVLDHLLEEYPEEMAGLFFGLVVASIVIAWRMLETRDARRVSVLIGTAAVTFWLLGFQSGPVSDPTLLAFFGAGAIAICAMILPGISGSFILLMMGMYGAVLDAVTERDATSLLVFMIGAVIGLALFSTALGWLLDRHYDTVLAALIGLMAGSLRVLWPWPNGVGIISDEADEAIDGTGLEWPESGDIWGPLLLGVLAAALVLGLSALAERRSSARDSAAFAD
jgi:putative membrane protein